MLLKQKQALTEELAVAKRALAPTESALAAERQKVGDLEAAAAARKAEEGVLRRTLEELHERNLFLAHALAQAQVQTRHVKARAERAEEKVAGTAQRLAAERGRHRGVAAGTADMLDRVAQIEASFGSLLKPAAEVGGGGGGRLAASLPPRARRRGARRAGRRRGRGRRARCCSSREAGCSRRRRATEGFVRGAARRGCGRGVSDRCASQFM